MSGGVKVKASREPPSSGIPLPRSLLTFSPKADSRHRASDLPRASTQTPRHTPTHTPSHTPTHSPLLLPRSSGIPGPSSMDSLGDASLKSQLFQRTGALPGVQGSRSACNSPLTQRRIPLPKSKDTFDLVTPDLAYTPTQFLCHANRNRNTFTNNNQSLGASNLGPSLQLRRGGSSNILSQTTSEGIQGREEEFTEHHPAQSTMMKNSNLCSSVPQRSFEDAIRGRSDSTNQSDEEMETPEDSSPDSIPGPLPMPPITFTMPVISKMSVKQDQGLEQETHAHRVNMAAVAPFSYR